METEDESKAVSIEQEPVAEAAPVMEPEPVPEPAPEAVPAPALTTLARVTKSSDTHFTLGGYGVVFGGVDLTGETFTKDTDFWLDRLSPTPPVLYQHGQDRTVKKRVLSRGTVTPDDIGLWVETQIALSDQYADGLRKLADAGRLGYSSGVTVPRLNTRFFTVRSCPC